MFWRDKQLSTFVRKFINIFNHQRCWADGILIHNRYNVPNHCKPLEYSVASIDITDLINYKHHRKPNERKLEQTTFKQTILVGNSDIKCLLSLPWYQVPVFYRRQSNNKCHLVLCAFSDGHCTTTPWTFSILDMA